MPKPPEAGAIQWPQIFLIVDDEADIRELIAGILQDEGYETRLARNSDAALPQLPIAGRRSSCSISGCKAPSSTGSISSMPSCANAIPNCRWSSFRVTAISRRRCRRSSAGAYDYIEKPFNADRLILVVGRALEASRLKRENEELKGRAGTDVELLGNSIAMRQLRQTLRKSRPRIAAC